MANYEPTTIIPDPLLTVRESFDDDDDLAAAAMLVSLRVYSRKWIDGPDGQSGDGRGRLSCPSRNNCKVFQTPKTSHKGEAGKRKVELSLPQ